MTSIAQCPEGDRNWLQPRIGHGVRRRSRSRRHGAQCAVRSCQSDGGRCCECQLWTIRDRIVKAGSVTSQPRCMVVRRNVRTEHPHMPPILHGRRGDRVNPAAGGLAGRRAGAGGRAR
jgi:hypothetical protein